MSGLRLAALYSYPPCRLGFCGQKIKQTSEILENFLKGKAVDENKVRQVLSTFEAAYPYYVLIAKSNRITDPLNAKVVEAYWLGNELLEQVRVNDLKNLIIKEFTRPGLLSLSTAKKRCRRIGPKAVAHHSFHVLVVGSVTGRVKFDERRRQLCQISWQEEAGKFISYHWGQRCQILTQKQKDNLEKYTRKTI
ncbi:hypothetical protein KKD62_03695 [Patescibacteria group bacterium]|nr:hypothetical protein [Patescibacteria group bacterium]MBU1931110.1 hypothetical protein [Patescibacteria group bacterium]